LKSYLKKVNFIFPDAEIKKSTGEPMRLEYFKIAPDAVKALAKASEYLESASIEPDLRYLVELRVSQINGCAYCVDLHTHQIRQTEKVTQQQIDCVTVWEEASEIYTDRQKAALKWAEAVTRIEATKVPDATYDEVIKIFNQKELVDLTFIISTMNAWNRLAVSFRRGPTRRF